MEAYRIADEPRPGGLAHLVVDPIWPMFAMMFGGAWIAFPWYIFNGIAMGSPTLKKEIALGIAGFIGAALIFIALVSLGVSGVIPKSLIPYGAVTLIIWKLGITYWLYATQAATFGIYTYFGGIARNGIIIVFLSSIMRPRVLNAVSEASGAFKSIVLAVLQ